MTEIGSDSPDKSPESKCPFCGAESVKAYGYRPRYECGTEKFQVFNDRGKTCLETEITRLKNENQILKDVRDELFDRIIRLKGLVREMVPFVRGDWCASEDQRTVWPDWDKAKEILSRQEVRAILEEK